jgi:ferric-dicitrate binding protein FerR (iron transport regulator)
MDQQLLDRFFRGECSAEEQSRVLSWYLSGEAEEELGKKIEAYWLSQEKFQAAEWGKASLYKKIQNEIGVEQEHRQNPNTLQNQPRSNKNWYYAAAASLVLSVTAAALYFFVILMPADTAPEVAGFTSQPDSLITKQTARGEKLTLTLPDSTTVRLNAESRLQYLSSSPREVNLQGEAFFDVKRDTLRPFVIQTAGIITTVLGTSFNIRAFADDDDIAVSVVSGEVKVEKEKLAAEDALRLLPGDQAVYHAKDTLLSKGRFDVDDVLAWKEGRLYFKNARFADIVQRLERWYGVEIEVKRSGIENGFSGSYTNRSLESVLEGMSFVLEFEYQIQDKKVIIR